MYVFPNFIWPRNAHFAEHLKGLLFSGTPTGKHYDMDRSTTETQYNRCKACNTVPSHSRFSEIVAIVYT